MDAKPGTPDGDRLEILATLVDHYESQHEPIEPPDPIDALLYHMESRGLTRRDLESFLGSRARVAEVLNRRRTLTIDMIRKLHEGLGISADVLIRPYSVRGSAA
jgi:HTH-type transcriptional regulator/antitoxin HigA